MPDFNLSSIAIAVAPFVALFVVKLLLDLRTAHLLVKYFYWLPLRNYFRDKPMQISGDWDHVWGSGGSEIYAKDVDRHGHPKLRQLGSYCYAEFYSQSVLYAFFGQIKDGYWVGDWFDVKDRSGYFGVFHLEVLSASKLKGLWIGHSKQKRDIRHGPSEWKRVGR